MTGSATIQGMNLSLIRKKTNTGKSLEMVTMNGMTIQKSVFDGEKGYKEAQGQKMDFTAEEVTEAKEDASLFRELSVEEGASLTGIEKVDGKDAYVVQVSKDKKNYYSTENGLKLKNVTTIEQMGQTVENTTMYGDYKAVKGVMFPYSLNVSFGPQLIDIKMNEVKVNEDLKDADFN